MSNGWHRTELGKHIELLSGFPFSSADYSEEAKDLRLLRGDNVIQGRIRWSGAMRWPANLLTDLDAYRLAVGDLVIAMDRTWVKAGLKVAQISEEDIPSLLVQRVARLRPKDSLDQGFMAQSVSSFQFEQYVKGNQTETAVPHISAQQICEFPISLPPLVEQRKIAKILRTWDEAIEKLDAIEGKVLQEQTALCQRVFEADYAAGGRLLRAREVFEPISERARPDLPLLAVMQDIGILRRDELDRRVTMPDGDTSTYKVVRPGNFVISLRSFEGGLEFSQVLGLVSPAYTVLRTTRTIYAPYYRYFFKSRSFVGRLDKMVFGIRDGKQIAFRDFGDMHIPHPQIDDQRKHAAALSVVAELATAYRRKRQALERQKRGLMQKLLTGEWRVVGITDEGTEK